MTSLEDVVRRRHSTRQFLSDRQVPRHVLNDALELAMRAPSNSNSQPWEVYFVGGEQLRKLSAALLTAVDAHPPTLASAGLPDRFADRRRESGALIYGAMGIARDDQKGRWAAQRRNWEFFGAPIGGIVCMHRECGPLDAVGVGMFLQTFLLSLTEQGVDSCVQVSIALYDSVLRRQLGIPEELAILCGMSIGYADPAFAANNVRLPRDHLDSHVTWLTADAPPERPT
ncbi:nitroreductase [Mycobacterium sp. M26]|uniref:nitroreductase n=1 Tax=Mycobacterium sp. M26 TaxID=1762962 RepID=UPI00073F2D52|nr:nitroreductase [Mycobacterium sp. M26]